MRQRPNFSEFFNSAQPQNYFKKHLDGKPFRFFPSFTVDKDATNEKGYLQHKPQDMIEIITGANDKTTRKVEQRDIDAYPEQWQAYDKMRTKPKTGWWLREWVMITPAQLADLENVGFQTIEEVAAMSDDMLQQAPHLRMHFKLASAWLKNAKSKQTECAKLMVEIDQKDKRIKHLEEQLTHALQRIQGLEGGPNNSIFV